jgi:hypothetical protein
MAVLQGIHARLALPPQHAVLVSGVLLAGLFAILPVGYLLHRGRLSCPPTLWRLCLAEIGVLLTGVYAFWVSSTVTFPADILIWAETDFVNDILKLRAGGPLFTAPADNSSINYPPGAPVLTYLIAWLAGCPTSLTAYRLIQVGFTLLAALAAVACTRRLAGEPTGPGWVAVWLPCLFLVASNSLTNPHVQHLHNDALAQLISILAYWVLIEYALAPRRWLLMPMILIPVAGLLVRQNLLIWGGLYAVHLAGFARPRSLRRGVLYSLATGGIAAAVLLTGYALEGEAFWYWMFFPLGHRAIEPARSVQHLLECWPYLSLGLIGGGVLLRGERFQPLLGAWVIWPVLLLSQAYISGCGWTRHHLGPGCLIAAIWFAAALPRLTAQLFPSRPGPMPWEDWRRCGFLLAATPLAFFGLGAFPLPLPSLPSDALRYVREIEDQFDGLPTDRVLLDLGSWVYVADGVIMRDRASTIATQRYLGVGDVSAMLERIQQRYYRKILVRRLHERDCHYEHAAWPAPAGLRQALLRHYRETGQIRAVANDARFGFGTIHVLEPR